MIQFVIGLHDHQPVGNFDHVFAEAYDRAYFPFLELLERSSILRVALHHTGPLLQWLEANRPDYLTRLCALVERNQVELLGGAFYEPILPIIPDYDRVGQIAMMSDWIERVFGIRPRGMWLAERVWEPTLPRAMRAAGIEFTVLDDSHFKSVGIREENALGYYLTEDQGDQVAVFPINETLRYKIPYVPHDEVIDHLRSLSSDTLAPTAIMADDGEKFGVWPDSYRHCWEAGWLQEFVHRLEANKDWLVMKTFSEVLDETAPIGRVYLPTASYIEMMEWAMPANAINQYREILKTMKDRGEFDENKIFVRGGFWRSFFSKYDESNHIHKKMLRVSQKLNSVPAELRSAPEYVKAQDELWRGQCNCGYWHGVFGGLYLSNLRTALYEHLIRAEKLLDGLMNKGKGWVQFLAKDFDVDGGVELLIDTPAQAFVFQPHNGGMMIEHDIRAINFNILNTLMRRREYYHAQLERQGDHHQGDYNVKISGLENLLTVDWYRRGSFIDHFLGEETTPENFREARYPEDGDFVGQPYECEWKKSRYGAQVTMRRQGFVMTGEGDVAVLVEKTLNLGASHSENSVHYRLMNISNVDLKTRFGVEFNANLQAGDAHDRYHEIDGVNLGYANRMVSVGAVPNASSFRVIEGWLGLTIEWNLSKPATHWRLPIETVSNSEGGIEKIYQSTVVMPVWDVELAPGETFDVTIDYAVFVRPDSPKADETTKAALAKASKPAAAQKPATKKSAAKKTASAKSSTNGTKKTVAENETKPAETKPAKPAAKKSAVKKPAAKKTATKASAVKKSKATASTAKK